MALEAGCDEVDARLSVHQLDEIMMADLTVKDSTGRKCTFHEKEAREHEGCHLGGGSFGEVYKAVHKVHGDVAVKLAKPGKEDQVVLMYQKEAGKHVLSLTSNHIVSIKGFVQCEKAACDCGCLIGIVMEYMKHGSLWDFRISKWQDRPDLWPLTNRMVHQISSGMHFLHSKDIIHRDLKLENVLVDGNLNVKVADLGLATNLQTSFGDERCGTNSHKPPEAFRTDLPNSTKVVTPEYDVYSFAMTLYELLTGIHPYSDRGFFMMMLLKVDSKQSPCLQPVPANTPEDLIRVMEESWSYEPNDRPNFREITDLVANLDTDPTHESLGYYLGEQRSSKKEGSADKESKRRGMENVTEQDQAPSRHHSNTNAAVHDTQTAIDNESVRMEGLTLNDPTLVDQRNGNRAKPITETVTLHQMEGQESHPPHLGQDNVVAQPEIQHSQPSSQESSKPSSYGQLKSQTSGSQYGCHDNNFQPTVEAEQLMEFTGFVSASTENSPGPSVSQPLQSYREDNKPVPVESSHGNTEYAVGHMAGGPIHQESLVVAASRPISTESPGVVPAQPSSTESPVEAPSQPRSIERDPTVIFDSSQPSDEDFEIKVKVRLNIQPRASMASKLDQIFICLERCKHRDYWDSNSSLSTMFSFSDITLKSLQLPATVDDDDFTLYFRVCNKRDLDKLHELSEKGRLRQSLYGFFVDVHLKEVCLPGEPDLKVESWEEQFNKGTAHFQKKEKANESKSDSESSESRQKPPNEIRSGASFTQTNCSGATQINTGKVRITMNSAPKNMVIGDQYNYYNHYRGSRGAGEGAGGHSSGRQPQKKKQGETKLCGN
ncbi:receptor-interacting serine/threonine-protein kinase 1 isoform X2 [Strongylocentrotus purpuratus]|uniref:Protein kinase domain-containing protein n=1 Tax=Strongylocentrotus purpuratus TaxID=7668 RepID=A0A7M7SU51_STRPU|nr:receptor-interacting serine/threonine-protein kinase 1 isoform X2 [Strongylocentrotus purpuratus]